MATETLRVGFVGAGSNTRNRHIPGLLAQPNVELVAVANRSLDSSQRVADEIGIARAHDHWRAIVDADDIDAVVIGTWPYMHSRVTVAALDAGKHVLCEARMANDLAEAQAMLAASQRNPHLVTQLVPGGLSLSLDGHIRKLIADGYLGDLLAVSVRQVGSFIDRDGPLTWRFNEEYCGVNIQTITKDYEDVCFWVGPATRVMAMARRFVPMRRDDAGVMRATLPDYIDIIAEMQCGAQMHMQESAVSGLAGAPGFMLHGSEGTLQVGGYHKLSGAKRGDKELKPLELPVPADTPEPFRDELPTGWRVEHDFVTTIRGEGHITRTRFEDGVRYTAFGEAVKRSLASGQAAAVPG